MKVEFAGWSARIRINLCLHIHHRSYLDTATLFALCGSAYRSDCEERTLKVPILGYGMAYVNVMAIDRTNRERAVKTMQRLPIAFARGFSFAVFAEGTRAKPGELLLLRRVPSTWPFRPRFQSCGGHQDTDNLMVRGPERPEPEQSTWSYAGS